MANPRQRRKARSGSHTSVSHSKRAKTLHLKKQPAIRGPKVLQEAWDKTKTVRQNYAALGLAVSLNPRASGGSEGPQNFASADAEAITRQAEASGSLNSLDEVTRVVPKGFGRIVRDEDGNIVDVEMNEDDEDEGDEVSVDDRGGLVEEKASVIVSEAASWVTGAQQHPDARTDVVRALEASAASAKPVPRGTSKGERGYLERLVEKYGRDVDAMARDRKLNTNQHTAGELSRAIRKAGGFAALGSG
ncbi:hypothetical protein PENSPDRAFT_599409 [Peniophora sp. CONT]|nr:hypothetical protein PENSPDRAFT_599409 [Peniophora sp. CONT]